MPAPLSGGREALDNASQHSAWRRHAARCAACLSSEYRKAIMPASRQRFMVAADSAEKHEKASIAWHHLSEK